jgi:hypothetical protein
LKVIFSGPANVSATVFDHDNGSYEAIALLVDPGYYTVIATIERSLCEGYREPKPSFYPSCKCGHTEKVGSEKIRPNKGMG